MSDLNRLTGQLVQLGETKTELEDADARIGTAKQGLAVSRQNLALLQAELDGRTQAIAEFEQYTAEQRARFREEAESVLAEVADWREEEAERRRQADAQAESLERAARELLGGETGGETDDAENADEESDDGGRQGSDNG